MIEKSQIGLKNKGKEEKNNPSENKALPQTAAKSPPAKAQQAAVFGSATVPCNQKKPPFFG